MPNKKPSRFDIGALRKIAGEKIFKRGEDYHRDGRATILDTSPKRILAQVSGTEDYRVTLTGSGSTINGECSCPNYEVWGFCKHMVAVALAANAQSGDEPNGESAFARIRAHLEAQSTGTLVSLILDLAERDAALFQRLDTISIITQSGKDVGAGLRRAIDRTTRITGYIDYGDVPAWSAVIDGLLETLASLIPAGQAELVLELAWHAVDRIESAMERLDDSDGYCSDLMHRASEIHFEAACVARPEPVELARALFTREMECSYETFSGAARRYAEILGDAGLREYRRLAQTEWDKLPVLGKTPRGGYPTGAHFDLFQILDFFAERDGDVDMRISLRSKDLSSSWNYLQLAEFCSEQGRDSEALQRAEEGLWIFEDEQPDERLLSFTVNLLLKADRRKDAETLLWHSFEKRPSLALYESLRKVNGGQTYERAVDILEKRLKREKAYSWYNPADLLVSIAMREKHFEAAWGTVRKHGASIGVQEKLARAAEAKYPGEALDVYTRRVDQLVGGGNSPAYEEAMALVKRMAGLRDATEQANYVASLKQRFGRKRNFMKLLG